MNTSDEPEAKPHPLDQTEEAHVNPKGITAGTASRRPRAALRDYAAAHRALLEASVASYGECGFRDDRAVIDAHDDAYEALPWPALLIALFTDLRVARELGYRRQVSA